MLFQSSITCTQYNSINSFTTLLTSIISLNKYTITCISCLLKASFFGINRLNCVINFRFPLTMVHFTFDWKIRFRENIFRFFMKLSIFWLISSVSSEHFLSEITMLRQSGWVSGVDWRMFLKRSSYLGSRYIGSISIDSKFRLHNLSEYSSGYKKV